MPDIIREAERCAESVSSRLADWARAGLSELQHVVKTHPRETAVAGAVTAAAIVFATRDRINTRAAVEIEEKLLPAAVGQDAAGALKGGGVIREMPDLAKTGGDVLKLNHPRGEFSKLMSEGVGLSEKAPGLAGDSNFYKLGKLQFLKGSGGTARTFGNYEELSGFKQIVSAGLGKEFGLDTSQLVTTRKDLTLRNLAIAGGASYLASQVWEAAHKKLHFEH